MLVSCFMLLLYFFMLLVQVFDNNEATRRERKVVSEASRVNASVGRNKKFSSQEINNLTKRDILC